MTGCPCHDPAVFGHIQPACPARSLSRHQLDGGSGQLVAFTRPLVLEPLAGEPPAAASETPDQWRRRARARQRAEAMLHP